MIEPFFSLKKADLPTSNLTNQFIEMSCLQKITKLTQFSVPFFDSSFLQKYLLLYSPTS